VSEAAIVSSFIVHHKLHQKLTKSRNMLLIRRVRSTDPVSFTQWASGAVPSRPNSIGKIHTEWRKTMKPAVG
jgi:hypothetical protein